MSLFFQAVYLGAGLMIGIICGLAMLAMFVGGCSRVAAWMKRAWTKRGDV